MDKKFDIQSYMTKGVERVVSDVLRATLRNPRESAYMMKFALASRAASKKKKENRGRRGTYSAVPHSQHHQPVQPALCRLLFQVQSCDDRQRTGKAADRRGMGKDI